MNLPNLITLARILSVPLVVWAITSGEMLHRLPAVRGGGYQRCGRRLPRQALRHDQRARRLPRSACRQGADRVDLHRARHQRGGAALAGDPGRLARPHDHRRRHVVVAGGQAGRGQAAAGLQAQYGGADLLRGARARFARPAVRSRMGVAGYHGAGRRLDVALGRRLCAGVGAPHGFGGNPAEGAQFGADQECREPRSGRGQVAIAVGLGRQTDILDRDLRRDHR